MKKVLAFVFIFSILALAGTFDFAQHPGLHFVENMGQVSDAVKYHVSISQGHIYFTAQGITYQLFYPKESKEILRVNNIKMDFVGANQSPKIEGLEKSSAQMNYFLGNEPEKWVSDVPTYSGIRYQELYPRIDLLVLGRGGKFKQEYLVRAGGNVDDIRIFYHGVDSIQINEKGQLEIFSGNEVIREDAPFSYQLIDGQKVEVTTQYSVEGENTLGFKVGEYNRDIDLIIDPELIFSTFLGGRDWDGAYEVHFDAEGNTYVTGETWSSDFPTASGSYDRGYNGNADAFVTKLGPEGKELIYSTFLGGKRDDCGDGVRVDSKGKAYVVGATESPNFPTKKAYDKIHNGDYDIFVAVLNPKGNKLLYSTYIGGSSEDEGIEIDIYEEEEAPVSAAESAAKFVPIYIIGESYSSDFPTTTGAYDTSQNGNDDIVVLSLTNKGKMNWSTFLGGEGEDDANWIVVDGEMNVHVTGYTKSTDFPTSEFAFDRSHNGDRDAFVSKLDSRGKELLCSTFFGGSRDDRGESIAVDADGYILVGGETDSTNLPTTENAYSEKYNGGENDGFLVKFTQMYESLIFSTYFGGSKEEEVEEMAIDADGRIYLTGDTSSTNFPTTKDAYQKKNRGDQDAYIAWFTADGMELRYSTYFGGSYDDNSSLLAIDKNGYLYTGGWTDSPNFPLTKGVVDREWRGWSEAWVAKFKFPAAGPTSLSGTVTDAATGMPIWGAVVKLRKGVKASAKTDKYGNFMIEPLEPGVRKLIVKKGGYKRFVEKKLTVDGPTNIKVQLKSK